MAIGLTISILVEVLLSGGVAAGAAGKGGGGGKSVNVKEWLMNKSKALASLLGKLGVKAAKHCLAS